MAATPRVALEDPPYRGDCPRSNDPPSTPAAAGWPAGRPQAGAAASDGHEQRLQGEPDRGSLIEDLRFRLQCSIRLGGLRACSSMPWVLWRQDGSRRCLSRLEEPKRMPRHLFHVTLHSLQIGQFIFCWQFSPPMLQNVAAHAEPKAIKAT